MLLFDAEFWRKFCRLIYIIYINNYEPKSLIEYYLYSVNISPLN